MIYIKKYYKYLFVLLVSFFLVFIIADAKTAITTFEEYEEQAQKLDLVLLFVVPITIIVIGGIYYYIKNKRIIRRLRLK